MTYSYRTKQSNQWKVIIDRYDSLYMRPPTKKRRHKKPVSVFKITVIDPISGQPIYQKPLWLMGSGSSITEIDLESIFLAYNLRFNIEHWFRFGKQQLLLDHFQTCDLVHSDHWLLFPVLATHMLYHSKDVACENRRPWEAKRNDCDLSPSQVRRAMGKVLNEIGSPAKSPTVRGVGKGRPRGYQAEPRAPQPVNYKQPQKSRERKVTIIVESDDLSSLGRIDLKAQNLPCAGSKLKKSVEELLKTGAATI